MPLNLFLKNNLFRCKHLQFKKYSSTKTKHFVNLGEIIDMGKLQKKDFKKECCGLKVSRHSRHSQIEMGQCLLVQLRCALSLCRRTWKTGLMCGSSVPSAAIWEEGLVHVSGPTVPSFGPRPSSRDVHSWHWFASLGSSSRLKLGFWNIWILNISASLGVIF